MKAECMREVDSLQLKQRIMYPFFLKGEWILINIYERGKKNKIKQSFKGVQYLYGNSRRISEEGERDRNRI